VIGPFDVEAEFVAQKVSYPLLFHGGEFEGAPWRLRSLQPSAVEHSTSDVVDRLKRLRSIDGVVRQDALAGAREPDLIHAIPLLAFGVVNAEMRTIKPLALAGVAHSGCAFAPGCGATTRPHRIEPTRDVFGVPSPEMFAERHPPNTLLRREKVRGNFSTFLAEQLAEQFPQGPENCRRNDIEGALI
jgi:hypothetical protein